jgi:hypothetical protein
MYVQRQYIRVIFFKLANPALAWLYRAALHSYAKPFAASAFCQPAAVIYRPHTRVESSATGRDQPYETYPWL